MKPKSQREVQMHTYYIYMKSPDKVTKAKRVKAIARLDKARLLNWTRDRRQSFISA